MKNAHIKESAKQLMEQMLGRFELFLTPVLLNIFLFWVIIHQSMTLSLDNRLQFQVVFLPNLLRLLIILFSSSASLVVLSSLRQYRMVVGFSDSTLIFRKEFFLPFIRVLLARWLLLLPWSITSSTLAVLSLPHLFKGNLSGTTPLLLIGTICLFLIKTYLSYCYSMSLFLLFEQVESERPIQAFHLVKVSKHIMKNHVWRYILLDWSFIGWHLLTVITLGIASFYTLPYRQITDVVFYQDLIHRLKKNKK